MPNHFSRTLAQYWPRQAQSKTQYQNVYIEGVKANSF